MKKWDAKPFFPRKNQFLAYRSPNATTHDTNTSYSYPRPCIKKWANMTALEYTVGEPKKQYKIADISGIHLETLNDMNEFSVWMYENGTVPK